MSASRTARALALALGAAAALLASACILDWDRIDPSKGAPPSAAGGSGGSGGAGTVCDPGEQAPCYSGPDGTERVGTCLGGTTTCNDDGSGFGPCEGEVLPIEENCNNTLDDDCDGEANELDAGCTCTPGTLKTCYDGPMGTEGVGPCQAGQKMCEASGNSETACAGQVVPRLDECMLPALDEDCDGAANAGCGSFGALYSGGGSDHHFWDVAVDGSDNIITVGQAGGGSVDFGNGAMAPLGGIDAIVAKFNSAGAIQWSKRWGNVNNDITYGVDVDGAGNIYVAGYFSDSLDIGQPGAPYAAVGLSDAFVAKLSPDGNTTHWATTFVAAATLDDQARAIDVNDAGTLVAVTGWADDTVDFGGGAQVTQGRDGWVMTLDGSTGAISNGRIFGGVDSGFGDEGRAVALIGNDVLVGGTYDEDLTFGGNALVDVSNNDGFVARLDSTLGHVWLSQLGGDNEDYVSYLAVDSAGAVLVHGDFENNIDIGGTVYQALDGSWDPFVVKLDGNSGSVVWAHVITAEEDQEAGGLAIDSADNVWFAVSHEYIADYGGGIPVLANGDDDWVVVKLDSSKNHIRTLRFGNDDNQDPTAIAAMSNDAVVVVGEVEDNIDFGLGEINGTSSYENATMAILPP